MKSDGNFYIRCNVLPPIYKREHMLQYRILYSFGAVGETLQQVQIAFYIFICADTFLNSTRYHKHSVSSILVLFTQFTDIKRAR